jgi:3-oxoacyl-[acyl-carrier protein] reductase
LAAGPDRAGTDYHATTGRKVAAGGVPPAAAADLVAFLLTDDASGITGKLISAQWDDWRDPELRRKLSEDGDLATLRRVDDMMVKSVPR